MKRAKAQENEIKMQIELQGGNSAKIYNSDLHSPQNPLGNPI